MGNDLLTTIYNPDVLTCLANLSNDEVFTPPQVVNDMLDMLPQELFSDPNTTFLDPACKSGVFLREIAKRLIKGLKDKIPDLQERLDHIYHKQLFGIAITELTGLASRRSLYCSKYPNRKYSVSHFDDVQGNIRYKKTEHVFKDKKCVFCGASEDAFGKSARNGLEMHAYEFIHTTNPEGIFNMKFDVIIGNPPYQLNDGGGTGTSATPLYDAFVSQAKKLNPRYLSMIIPARWYSGGKGLDDFRKTMLSDTHIRNLVDFFDPKDVFPGIDLSGGVCYFLWDRNNPGLCSVTTVSKNENSTVIRPLLENGTQSFIRFNKGAQIFRKVKGKGEPSFESIVSSRKPFGLEPNDKIHEDFFQDSVRVFAYPKNGFINKSCIRQNGGDLNKYKVFIAKAYGERGQFPYLVIGKPFLGDKGTCCTETYLEIGSSNNQSYCENIIEYMKTKFFRFLVLLKKNTQNAPKGVYEFVPMQDFSKKWTDQDLFSKYSFSKDEISFVESLVRPMEGKE